MIKIEHTTERIESIAGLPLVGKLISHMGVASIISKLKKGAGNILVHVLLTLVQGNTSYESLRDFRDDPVIKEVLDVENVFSPETVRLYLERMSGDVESLLGQLQACNIRLLEKASLSGIQVGSREMIPVDIDTSPMDNSKTKKEQIGYTYKGFVGYHPLFAYIGVEGYMLKSELRPGSQHCQKGTPEFIDALCADIAVIGPDKPVLFRLDSGNDSADTLRAILRDKEGEKSGHKLIIKRNLRQEDPQWWLKTAEQEGGREEPRPGKIRYTGKMAICGKVAEQFPELRVVYEVIDRKTDAQGNQELLPNIEVNTWWTNVAVGAEKVIELYHAHGTMEQFHSELKSDMGVERLPSGKYAVNQMILALAMCAFNILRFIGQRALAEKELVPGGIQSQRRRLGKVIRDIIRMACKVVSHSGTLMIKIWEGNTWTPVFDKLNLAFDLL